MYAMIGTEPRKDADLVFSKPATPHKHGSYLDSFDLVSSHALVF